MDTNERASTHWRALDEAFPDGAPQALVDALDAADRAAELAEGTVAALRDKLAEVCEELGAEGGDWLAAVYALKDAADKATNERCRRIAAERDEACAEVERLRAIIEGRTTPPTAAEVAAHDGAWLLCEARGIEGTDGSAGDVADWTHVKTLCIAKEYDVERCFYFGSGPDVSVGDVIIADRDGMGTTYWWADGTRWWPLDAEGRPCAWPTAKGGE